MADRQRDKWFAMCVAVYSCRDSLQKRFCRVPLMK